MKVLAPLAVIHILSKEIVLPECPKPKKQLNNEIVSTMTDLRTASNAFLVAVKQDSDLFTRAGTDKLHCAVLHDVFNDAALAVDVEHETWQAQASCTAVWTQSILCHAELIEKACPKWELYRETLADDIPIRKEMVHKFPAYGSVGELSAKLKEQLNFVKAIQRDGFGSIVDPSVYKKGRDMVDFGVESVAFAFFLRNHCLEFPKFKNVPMLATEVHKVRMELKSTRVTLTPQMQKLLDLWEDGTLLQQQDGVPGATALPVPVPVPVSVTEADAAPATPASASCPDLAPSSGVKRPAPEDGALDPSEPAKKTKLRDMIANAKRKNHTVL